MRVVLIKSAPGLGQKGDILEVSDGYGKNFLLPRQIALLAGSPEGKDFLEIFRKQQKQQAGKRERKTELLKKLNGKVLEFTRPANRQGRLYEGISAADIVKSLAENLKTTPLELSPDIIKLSAPLKKIGLHKVPLSHENFHLIIKILANQKNEG